MSQIDFVILAQSPMKGKPAESAFDNPSFRQYLEAFHAQHLTNDFNEQLESGFDFGQETAAVEALVSQYLAQPAEAVTQFGQHHPGTGSFAHVGRCYDQGQHKASTKPAQSLACR